MTFKNELEFEKAFIKLLTEIENQWEPTIIEYPTEEILIDNWKQILSDNNINKECLNGQPLTESEMSQILDQIRNLQTPLKLNGFINGKTVTIKRDNKKDTLHFGKEVSLNIYDKREIKAGKTRYQIARQPKFMSKADVLPDRRGDVMLLINGMPLIHIELKNSNVSYKEACKQIRKYSNENVFTGIFSLIQIFVAMNPEEAVYFANPGRDGKFNDNYFFHWADVNNEPINTWKKFTSELLSIPMAHQMIGFYTIADNADGILKVMRSYQYNAVAKICDAVLKHDWDTNQQRGGYVWHTTGSGKTMTSFKAAQIISQSDDADKVIFLMDRIALSTQSLEEYRSFAEANETVQDTNTTNDLITKLKSNNYSDKLIVTSIQKMSRIQEEGVNTVDIELASNKRIVIIVDEAHRSTFGDMLLTIKKSFPKALFFGFTGTPIDKENQIKDNTTADIFGNELCRYSIADGIRDENVLGFDPYKILTYKDIDLRTEIALRAAKASSIESVFEDSEKLKVYRHFMDSSKVSMIDIENMLPSAQYKCEVHYRAVVEDIKDNWIRTNSNNKFHAIFATSSINEAIIYYRLFKEIVPKLKVTALFDANYDNKDNCEYKQDGLVEIITDYNNMYEQKFSIKTHDKFKNDIATRLAHKDSYKYLERTPEKRIDILIVVDQMLTGFDSKWVNTLYLDKILDRANLIQAFSRTNRLFGRTEKPHGIIRYYKKPHTMENNIIEAVKSYSGNKPFGIFVEKLDKNLEKMNTIFLDIKDVFKQAQIDNFEKLPDSDEEIGKFIKLFNSFNKHLESAKIQGFNWEQTTYEFEDVENSTEKKISLDIDGSTFITLLQRYKEINRDAPENGGKNNIPFDIESSIIEIDTAKIDTEYMNKMFKKYLKCLIQEGKTEEEKEQYLNELRKSFAILSQEKQKIANLILHEVQAGERDFDNNKNLIDYITEYQYQENENDIKAICDSFKLDEKLLRDMIARNLTKQNINEFERFSKLLKSVDSDSAKAFFEEREKKKLTTLEITVSTDRYLKDFLLNAT